MRHHGNIESDRQRDEEANQAGYEAAKGALAGAAAVYETLGVLKYAFRL